MRTKATKEELYLLYVVRGKPMSEVASELGIAVGTVYNYLHKYGIETREPSKGMLGKKLSKEHCEKISKTKKGKPMPRDAVLKSAEAHKVKEIGHRKKRADGYIAVYYPRHPKCNREGYIMEHHLIMESIIGRHLEKGEVVHHMNGKRDDNRKENLKLMTQKEHSGYHMKMRWEEKKGGMTY